MEQIVDIRILKLLDVFYKIVNDSGNTLRSLLNFKIDANLHDIICIWFYVAHLHLEIGSVRTG